jgi:hypothetical protein
MSKAHNRFSFVVMAILVFIGCTFCSLGWVSTGPNLDLSIAWLDLHRHGDTWTVGSFRPMGMIALVLVSVLLTWVLAKALGHRIAQPGASPNGGPAERLGNSGVPGGPPSVS